MIKQINKKQLIELLNKGAQVIDVREQPDPIDGSIDESEHWPLSSFGLRQKDISNTRPIVFYCRSGLLSIKAAEIAEEWTKQEVYSLEGGLLKYQDQKKSPNSK